MSKLNTDDIEKLKKTVDPYKFGEILRESAEKGSFDSQLMLSTMTLVLMNDIEGKPQQERIEADFLKYTKMAAENGDAGSQFNLGKFYFSKIDASDGKLYEDDYPLVREAEYWLKKAASQGDEKSILFIKDLEWFFNKASA